MSQQRKIRKIEELEQELSMLKEQQDKLNNEAREWADRRDRFNQQIKGLQAEILELRNKRNELNTKVKEMKQLREKMKREIEKRIEEIKKIRREIEALNKKRPSRSPQILKEEFESLEWKIQTTPLSLQEEKELVESVKELELQLNIYRKIEQHNQKMIELKTEVRNLETKRRLYHETLTETAQKSQEAHEKMIEKIEKAKGLKTEADNLHNNFLIASKKTRPVREKFRTILGKVKILRNEVKEEEEREKKKSEKAIRKKIEERAREKLKRGEKLTWEEFQILAEKGITAQD